MRSPEREKIPHQCPGSVVEVSDMDAAMMLETVAIALTCVLALVGLRAAAWLRSAELQTTASAGD